MRLPSSPGYGGKSRPSASRPSFTQFTMRAMAPPSSDSRRSRRQRLAVDQRLALVIVEGLLLLRQVGDGCAAKAALQEPVGRAGGEHEQARELEPPCARLDLAHQRLAIPYAPEIRVHRQRRELSDPLVRERIERRAADDVVIVLRDDEPLDLRLQPLARAAAEDTLLLQRLDDRQDAAGIVDGGIADVRERGRRHHGADAVAREELEQQRAVMVPA